MKTMTCKQLGGACDLEFHAETFQDMANMSMEHGREMMMAQEPAHLAAMDEMSKMMENPEAMQEWMKNAEESFNALSVD